MGIIGIFSESFAVAKRCCCYLSCCFCSTEKFDFTTRNLFFSVLTSTLSDGISLSWSYFLESILQPESSKISPTSTSGLKFWNLKFFVRGTQKPIPTSWRSSRIYRIFRYLTSVIFRLVITVARFWSFSGLFGWKFSPSNSCTFSSIASLAKKYVDSFPHKNRIQKHNVVIVEAWRIVALQEWKKYQ